MTTNTSENMLERLQREQREIETRTTPHDLVLQQERRERLKNLVEEGRFIGSVWGYDLREGQQPSEASVLWVPYSWHVDSGRRSLLINEFRRVRVSDRSQKALGSGELERGRELLFGIFQTMAARGSVQLVSVPEQPLASEAQWRY